VNKSDVSDDTRSKIKIATLGSSESLKVGQPVIAIGNALGYGQSVTVGVLSAKDREVSFTDGTMTLLQTDAAINPGNSGGVLINMNGEVIGINNAKLADTSVEGMCYAIPISTANSILNDLMNASDISSENAAYLGIVGKNIDASYSKALGMPQGIYVSQIVSGSPAEESGIEAGDIITAVDGNNVSTMQGLKEKISIKKAGTKMTVTLKRAKQNGEYEEKKIEVTLGKASDFQDASTNNQSGNNNGQNQNGGQNGTDQFGNGGQNGNGGYYYDQGNGNGNGNGNGEEFDPFYYFFN
jgi:serine protease Do